jgi:hypothetical protein
MPSTARNGLLKATIGMLLVCLVVLLYILTLQSPASFRRAISTKDRIEIEGYQSKIVVSEEEARNAVRSLRHGYYVGHVACLPEAQVRFYQGTNLLTQVGMCTGLLLIEDKWYMPHSESGKGLTRTWCERLRETGRLKDSTSP